MTSRERLKRKEVEDVLGGDDAWKDVDSTASMSFHGLNVCIGVKS
jgi:hypothetical protein